MKGQMTEGVRRGALAAHVAISVGWFGAVIAYLVLDLATLRVSEPQALRAAYLAMERIVSTAIVPLALATLVTGLAMSLGTKWGLFRHWWVLISLMLTLVATAVLLLETRTIAALAAVAADAAAPDDQVRRLGSTLLHSAGGAIVLLTVLVLNVYKPRGLTSYGWRQQQLERQASQGASREADTARR